MVLAYLHPGTGRLALALLLAPPRACIAPHSQEAPGTVFPLSGGSALSERDSDSDDSEGGGRPGVPIDPLRLWAALRKRWQWILAAAVLGAFIGAAIAKKFAQQTFSAQAVLTW